MVFLNWRIQGLLRRGRLGDRFLVRHFGSSTFEELEVTHLQENGLWISMDPKETPLLLRFDVGLDQVFPRGVEGGLPRDGGRMGGCVLRMGRVYSERARDQIFAETAEIALAHCAAPPAPPEFPPPEAPTWDFRRSRQGCSVGDLDQGCWFLAEPCEGYEVGTDVTADVLAGAVTGLRPLVLLQGIWVRAESMLDPIEYMAKMAEADAEILEQQRKALALRQSEIE